MKSFFVDLKMFVVWGITFILFISFYGKYQKNKKQLELLEQVINEKPIEDTIVRKLEYDVRIK